MKLTDTFSDRTDAVIQSIVSVILLFFLMWFAMPAEAATTTTPLTADTFTFAGSTGTNNGTQTNTVVGGNDLPSSFEYNGFYKAVLPSSNLGTISAIELFLYKYDQGGDHTATTFSLHENNGSWTETGVTWNNQPSYSGTTIYSQAKTSGVNAWYDLPIQGASSTNSLAKTWGDTVDLRAVMSAVNAANYDVFYSREYTTDPTKQPYLLITYTPAGTTTSSTTTATSTDANVNTNNLVIIALLFLVGGLFGFIRRYFAKELQ